MADLSLPVSVSQGIKSIIQVLFVYIGLLPAIVVIIIGVSFDAVVYGSPFVVRFFLKINKEKISFHIDFILTGEYNNI